MLIYSLRPSDAIWWHRSGSTLAQVMACCLMAPSHYLNQSWLTISKVEWLSSEGNFIRNTSAINQLSLSHLEHYQSKISLKPHRGQWVKENAHGITKPQRVKLFLTKYLSIRRILGHQVEHIFRLHHLVKADNIRVVQHFEDLNFTVNFLEVCCV